MPFLLWRVIAKRAWWLAGAMLAGALLLGGAAAMMVLQFLHLDGGAALVLAMWSAAGAGLAGSLFAGGDAIRRRVLTRRA